MTPAQFQRINRGRASKAKGRRFEESVLIHLRNIGMADGAILATPTTVRRGQIRNTARVLGDIVGVWRDGRACLCECKVRTENGRHRKPRPSDFMPHQRDTLMRWHRAGARVLVAYTLDGLTSEIEAAARFFTTPADTATKETP